MNHLYWYSACLSTHICTTMIGMSMHCWRYMYAYTYSHKSHSKSRSLSCCMLILTHGLPPCFVLLTGGTDPSVPTNYMYMYIYSMSHLHVYLFLYPISNRTYNHVQYVPCVHVCTRTHVLELPKDVTEVCFNSFISNYYSSTTLGGGGGPWPPPPPPLLPHPKKS